MIFVPLDPFEDRLAAGQSIQSIMGAAGAQLSAIQEAVIFPILPPPVRGIGNAGGFKMMLQDRQGRGPEVLQASANELLAAANQDPDLRQVFTPWRTSTPQLFVDIDRVRAEKLNIPVGEVIGTLETISARPS